MVAPMCMLKLDSYTYDQVEPHAYERTLDHITRFCIATLYQSTLGTLNEVEIVTQACGDQLRNLYQWRQSTDEQSATC